MLSIQFDPYGLSGPRLQLPDLACLDRGGARCKRSLYVTSYGPEDALERDSDMCSVCSLHICSTLFRGLVSKRVAARDGNGLSMGLARKSCWIGLKVLDR